MKLTRCGTVVHAEMCPKHDDPLTTGQGNRTIAITTGGTGTALSGVVRINFNGEATTLSASVEGNTAASCASAFEKMRSVRHATCGISGQDATTKGAVYTIAFTEWTHMDGENNLLFHFGNPPLTSFTCDISGVTSTNSPTCAIADVVATNVIGEGI
jgi:hypothetical protein